MHIILNLGMGTLFQALVTNGKIDLISILRITYIDLENNIFLLDAFHI